MSRVVETIDRRTNSATVLYLEPQSLHHVSLQFAIHLLLNSSPASKLSTMCQTSYLWSNIRPSQPAASPSRNFLLDILEIPSWILTEWFKLVSAITTATSWKRESVGRFPKSASALSEGRILCLRLRACKDHGWRLESKVLRHSDAHSSAHRLSKDENTGGRDAGEVHSPVRNGKGI
jgi:hypothetical protein